MCTKVATRNLVEHTIIKCDVICTFRCIRRKCYIECCPSKFIGGTAQIISCRSRRGLTVVNVICLCSLNTGSFCPRFRIYTGKSRIVSCNLVNASFQFAGCLFCIRISQSSRTIVMSLNFTYNQFIILILIEEVRAALTIRIDVVTIDTIHQNVSESLSPAVCGDLTGSLIYLCIHMCRIYRGDCSTISQLYFVFCYLSSLILYICKCEITILGFACFIDRLPSKVYACNVCICGEVLIIYDITTYREGCVTGCQVLLSYCNSVRS